MKLSKELKIELALGIIPEGSKLQVRDHHVFTYLNGAWYPGYEKPQALHDQAFWTQQYIRYFSLPLWMKIFQALRWRTLLPSTSKRWY